MVAPTNFYLSSYLFFQLKTDDWNYDLCPPKLPLKLTCRVAVDNLKVKVWPKSQQAAVRWAMKKWLFYPLDYQIISVAQIILTKPPKHQLEINNFLLWNIFSELNHQACCHCFVTLLHMVVTGLNWNLSIGRQRLCNMTRCFRWALYYNILCKKDYPQ